jgi:hypothetical protein
MPRSISTRRPIRPRRTVSVAPQGDCPTWRQFLATITGNDPQVQAYLARTWPERELVRQLGAKLYGRRPGGD